MKPEKRIFCVEGLHDWGDGNIEPTVRPMLELLQKIGYWEDFCLRTCRTVEELKLLLEREWFKCCSKGSVLYFNTHGHPGNVHLFYDEETNRSEDITVAQMKEWRINFKGCYVHFGGCFTFGGDQQNLRNFLHATKAVSISGYAADRVGWLDWNKPGLALELLFFGLLSDIRSNNPGRTEDLGALKSQMQKRFPDCKFRMWYPD